MSPSKVILAAIKESGRTDRSVSFAAVGNPSSVSSIRRGVDLRASTIEAFCQELGLEFYVGPPRPVPAAIAQALGLPEDCKTDEALSAIAVLMQQRLTEAAANSPAFAALIESRMSSMLDENKAALQVVEGASKQFQEIEEAALDAMKQLDRSDLQSKALVVLLRGMQAIEERLGLIEGAINEARNLEVDQ